MPLRSRIASLCRNLWRKPDVERELDRELHAFLDQLIDRKMAEGLSPAEARRAAQL